MKQRETNRKVNEEARSVIAGILLLEISDPRLEYVTVTQTRVSYDRSYCDVFYSCSPDSYAQSAKAFEKAKGKIRALMAKKLSWRVTPELRFHLDDTIDTSYAIQCALDKERKHFEDGYETE